MEGYYCKFCKITFNAHSVDIKLILWEHIFSINHVDSLEMETVGICGTLKICAIANIADFYIKCTSCDKFFEEYPEAIEHLIKSCHVEYLKNIIKNRKPE